MRYAEWFAWAVFLSIVLYYATQGDQVSNLVRSFGGATSGVIGALQGRDAPKNAAA